jgi:hypothetical protein
MTTFMSCILHTHNTGCGHVLLTHPKYYVYAEYMSWMWSCVTNPSQVYTWPHPSHLLCIFYNKFQKTTRSSLPFWCLETFLSSYTQKICLILQVTVEKLPVFNCLTAAHLLLLETFQDIKRVNYFLSSFETCCKRYKADVMDVVMCY